ncbi:MAG: 30S ribosomal protein S12 methylthiotransferase RimO [Muribaculaceae bacterium]|nr:30S ribosomal protein S12 methylthiotransferase RimO [Muribaculaceae bacterium]
MIKNRIDIITMGCSKNLIDSERIIRRLEAKGYTVAHDPEIPEGEYVVVNTCGFIADAKEESIEMILDLAEKKNEEKIGKIVAMGCLTERYKNDLASEIPEIDIILGKFDWNSFIDSLPDITKAEAVKNWERTLTTPPHSAYLKISEGCNRFCAFCAIPLITGRHKSRPIEEILDETKSLVAKGVREFNVIAQDLSSYGLDLYNTHKLPELIDRMAEIPGVEWIRLHYAYPADFPYEILDVMARHDNVCKYIDIALQHISDKVLDNMRRHITGKETIDLINEMRRRVPDIKIRTTLMVGFPGEGEKEFEELLEFVKSMKIDRMGAFAYSEEDDTWAAKNLEDNVPQDVKEKRLEILMEAQTEVYEEKNRDMIGKTVRLIVDEIDGDTRICRSQWDSPEVDMNYYVSGSDAKPGDFIMAKITGDELYEYYAEAL